MRAENLQDKTSQLSKLNWFQECIILNVRWLQYGYTFEIDFNMIWDENGKLRQDINETKLVTLNMIGVQEIFFNNSFSYSQLKNPEKMNWGMNEISRISVELMDNEAHLELQFYRLRIHWEQSRAITIKCLDFEVVL